MKYQDKMEIIKEWEDTVENKEFEYPMWFKNEIDRRMVGNYFNTWASHIDTKVWEQVENPDLVTEKEIEKETLSNMIKKNGGVGNPGNKREWIDFEDGNKAKNPNSKHYELWEDFEAIDVIKLVLTEEEYRGFLKGNILKYRLRVGKKDDVSKEIEKIKDYERELNK